MANENKDDLMSADEPSAAAVAVDGVGQRLAQLRLDRGIKVSELARRIGVSASLISQIERGQSRPSVVTLFGLAEELDVAVDAFFHDPIPHASVLKMSTKAFHEATGLHLDAGKPSTEAGAEPGSTTGPSAARQNLYVVRSSERASIDVSGGVRWDRLTPVSLERIEFLEIYYEPKAQSHADLYRHPGFEMLVVLEGTFRIYIGFEEYELHEGDSITFPSSLPHRCVNPGDTPARAVSVVMHDTFDRATLARPEQHEPPDPT